MARAMQGFWIVMADRISCYHIMLSAMLAIVSVAVTKKAATFDLTQHMPDCAPPAQLASLVRACSFARCVGCRFVRIAILSVLGSSAAATLP